MDPNAYLGHEYYGDLPKLGVFVAVCSALLLLSGAWAVYARLVSEELREPMVTRV